MQIMHEKVNLWQRELLGNHNVKVFLQKLKWALRIHDHKDKIPISNPSPS